MPSSLFVNVVRQLERAERELVRFCELPTSGYERPDRLPHLLNAVLLVHQDLTQHARAVGRSKAFWDWWHSEEMSSAGRALNGYRNRAMKGEKGVAKPADVIDFETHLHGLMAGGVHMVIDDERFGAEAVFSDDPHVEVIMRFNGGPWSDREIVDVMACRLAELRNVILPKAARLLGETWT